MDYRTGFERCADFMKNTYIRKDVDVKLALLKGKNDPEPKKTGFKINLTLSLAEATAILAGVALIGVAAYECLKKSCEAKAMRRLINDMTEISVYDEDEDED